MSGFVVSLMAGLIAIAGFVFDGSRLIAARAEVNDHAANAARAAAQEIIDVRLGTERIDPEQGVSVAMRYLHGHALTGVVRIDGLRAELTIQRRVSMTLLSLVGIDSRTVSVTRSVVVVDE